jgi:hypothetical protein
MTAVCQRTAVSTLGTGGEGGDVLPTAGGILGGITIGVGMGLGMGNLGSGGGSGNLDTGEGGSVRDTGGDVLHGFVSMNRNSADLGSDSSALGHCDGLRCDFLCTPGGVWFKGVSPQHDVQKTRDDGLGKDNDALGGTLSVAQRQLGHAARRQPRHGRLHSAPARLHTTRPGGRLGSRL